LCAEKKRFSYSSVCKSGNLQRLMDGWMDGWSSVLRPRQHRLVIWETVFTGQKTQPTVSKYWSDTYSTSV